MELADKKGYFLKWSELKAGKTYDIYVALDQGYLDLMKLKILSKDNYEAVTGSGSDRAMLKKTPSFPEN